MKFKYKAYGDNLRPVIPVTLFNSGESVECEVLVDSGSDYCFFDAEVGQDIGISRENSELREVFGVGGKISVYHVHSVTMIVGEKQLNIPVGFMHNLGGSIVSYGIVGQKGFFDAFTVKFDLSKEEIEFREKKS